MRYGILQPTVAVPFITAPASAIAGFLFRRLPPMDAADNGQLDGAARPGQYLVPEDSNPWQQYWGESYGLRLKRWMLTPVFSKLDGEDKIGSLIIDVGSGAVPVTGLLRPAPARRRICVDIASDNAGSAGSLGVRLDAEKVGERRALDFRKALLRVCAFLAMDPRTEIRTELSDTIVFSEILNYVDYRQVIRGFSNFLKPGGRIIVINLPFRGNRSLFSGKGLKNNLQLYTFLEEERFEIEHKAFPKRPLQEADELEEFIVLVARKPVQTPRIPGAPLSPASVSNWSLDGSADQ